MRYAHMTRFIQDLDPHFRGARENISHVRGLVSKDSVTEGLSLAFRGRDAQIKDYSDAYPG